MEKNRYQATSTEEDNRLFCPEHFKTRDELKYVGFESILQHN